MACPHGIYLSSNPKYCHEQLVGDIHFVIKGVHKSDVHFSRTGLITSNRVAALPRAPAALPSRLPGTLAALELDKGGAPRAAAARPPRLPPKPNLERITVD